jgi:hypothetical protein
VTYASESQQTSSEKVIFATIEGVKEYKIFTLHAGSVYYKDVNNFCTGVNQGTTSLTQVFSVSLNAGEFYFDPLINRVYLRTTDSSNPNTKEIAFKLRFFFSNAPYNKPFDLNTGVDVHWDARIESIGGLKQSLDDENVGTVIETKSSLSLINTDGYFDEIFDTHIWENQAVEFYSWFTSIPITQATKIFSGFIDEKSFDDSKIGFSVNDFTFRLRDTMNLDTFKVADGTLSDSDLYTYKKRIYGKAKQVKTIGLDKVLDGFASAITVSGTAGLDILTFSASILSTIFTGDEITLSLNGENVKIGIDSITSPTTATTGSSLSSSFANASFTISPAIPSRNKNRNWHIAGHKLRRPSTTITSVLGNTEFEVASVEGLYAGDLVDVNGDNVLIQRISNNKITTSTAITPTPVVSDTLFREPVYEVLYNGKTLIIDRDWSLTNTTEAILNINNLAEFNIAQDRTLFGTNLSFTNGSRSVTSSSATFDLRTLLKPRDWIKSNDITHTIYYEVSQVNEFSIDLVIAYAGSNTTGSSVYRSPEYISDESLITVSTYGLESASAWVKTPSDVVKHILNYDAGFASVNNATFNKAKDSCDYIVSLVIGPDLPKIRDVINLVNESVFGSLYTNTSYELCYSILNSEKPETLTAIKDEDIIDFSMSTKNKIISGVTVKYRPFVDAFTGEDTFEIYEEQNAFVNRVIGIVKEEEKTLYLFEDDKAKIIAQRYMFFNSLSISRMKVKAKAGFFLTNLNDKIYLQLDRLYKRYGGADRMKIGIVSARSINGLDSEVEFNDLGNVFNRVPAIAPNTALDYSSASRSDIIKYGYILDNTTSTPDNLSEVDLGLNLIG